MDRVHDSDQQSAIISLEQRLREMQISRRWADRRAIVAGVVAMVIGVLAWTAMSAMISMAAMVAEARDERDLASAGLRMCRSDLECNVIVVRCAP